MKSVFLVLLISAIAAGSWDMCKLDMECSHLVGTEVKNSQGEVIIAKSLRCATTTSSHGSFKGCYDSSWCGESETWDIDEEGPVTFATTCSIFRSTGVIIGMVAAFVVLLIAGICVCYKRRQAAQSPFLQGVIQ